MPENVTRKIAICTMRKVCCTCGCMGSLFSYIPKCSGFIDKIMWWNLASTSPTSQAVSVSNGWVVSRESLVYIVYIVYIVSCSHCDGLITMLLLVNHGKSTPCFKAFWVENLGWGAGGGRASLLLAPDNMDESLEDLTYQAWMLGLVEEETAGWLNAPVILRWTSK